jgi:hypothetical protein
MTFMMLVLALWLVSAAPLKLPYVVKNSCPFEGCVFRAWVAGRHVAVRTRMSRTASIAFTVDRWDWVRAVTGVSVIYQPDVIRFVRDTQRPVDRRKGDMLEVLQYAGEGFATIWFDGRVIEGADLSRIYNGACGDECDGRVERPGRRVWWIQMENAEGIVGWTDEADAFGNKDAHGGPWEGQVPAAEKPVRRPRPRP